MSEFIKFLKDDIFNGKKSFFATFITSWMIWNWQVIIVLFFDHSFPKIEEIGKVPKILEILGTFSVGDLKISSNLAKVLNDLYVPFLIAYIRITIIGLFVRDMEIILHNFYNKKNFLTLLHGLLPLCFILGILFFLLLYFNENNTLSLDLSYFIILLIISIGILLIPLLVRLLWFNIIENFLLTYSKIHQWCKRKK